MTDRHLDAVLGQQIPGGCDDCNAYQMVTLENGVYLIGIFHDNGCPHLAGVTR